MGVAKFGACTNRAGSPRPFAHILDSSRILMYEVPTNCDEL